MHLNKVSLLLAAALCLASALSPAAVAAGPVSDGVPDGAVSDAFYDPPVPLPAGAPGDVIRHEPVQVFLAPLVPIPGVTAQRVMYLSRDSRDQPIPVTGTVLTPTAPWSGPGERPIVAYAIGVHGLGDECAPSRQLAAGVDVEASFIAAVVEQGYGLAITDYEGLGTPLPATGVDRVSQGHAVLDSLRAAQRLPDSGLPRSGPVATWGYSQGGEGSGSALELHPSYAPELNLIGGFAASIPSDQLGVAFLNDGGPYAGLLGYTINGYVAAYPELHLEAQLNEAGRLFAQQTAVQCVLDVLATHPLTETGTLFTDGRPLAVRMTDPDWAIPVTEQRLGLLRPAVPVLVGQSINDDVIDYLGVQQVVLDWCARGATVLFNVTAVPMHGIGYGALVPEALAWLAGRVNGDPPPTNCGEIS